MIHDFYTCHGWHPWSAHSWVRRAPSTYTQGIVTEMAYPCVTNIQMPCGDHETQSLSGYASPLSSNWALIFHSPVDGLRPFSCPKHAFSVWGRNPIFHQQLLEFFVIAHYTDFSDRGDKHRQWQKYFGPWSQAQLQLHLSSELHMSILA